MPVPSSINDLSTTPALNSPAGSESPSTIDDYLRTHAAFIRQINDLAATKADDSAVVKLTGAQTVAGTKTFSASPVVPDATAPKHPVTKDQLDAKAPIASPAFTGSPTAPNPATGLRSTALATMQKFADEFAASKSGSGYQKLPSGLIIQWGAVTQSAYNQVAVVYPIAFPTANLCQSATTVNNTNIGNGASVYGATLTGHAVSMNSAYSFTWFAIGH